jgi:UDP-N-acetylglucosamine--N-acetylmuramyl-(pentapeptide) pyrophosphoryl-undecaprenol N-acetylglucosamine transferase
MASAIANADLVISRAGAGANAELCAIGRPRNLVPLPISGDHQLHNAQGLEKAGGAICMPSPSATPEAIAERIAELAGDPERLARMAESARGWGRPDAAERICQDLLGVSGLGKASPSAGQPPPAEPAPVEPKPPAASAEAKSEAAPATPAGGEA